jgi:hypothetical protein
MQHIDWGLVASRFGLLVALAVLWRRLRHAGLCDLQRSL